VSQHPTLPTQLDERLVQERARLYAAGYSNGQTITADGATIQVELPAIAGISYSLQWHCPQLFPAVPPQLSVREQGIDSYGEVREGNLLVIVPQLNKWNEAMTLVDLVAEVQQRLQAGEFMRLHEATQSVIAPAAAPEPEAIPPVPQMRPQPLPVPSKELPARLQPQPAPRRDGSTGVLYFIIGGALLCALLISIGVGLLFARGNATAGDNAAIAQTSTALNATSEAATSVAAATATIVAEWADLERLPLEQQLAKLQAFVADGRTTDLNGVPLADRIFATWIAYIKELIAPPNPSFLVARGQAALALEAAQGNPDWQAQANDTFAAVLIAEAEAALDRNNVIDADKILAGWGASDPLNAERQAALDSLRQRIDDAKAALSRPEQIRQAWTLYDQGVQAVNWEQAVRALDAIISITGPEPDAVDFPTPEYDPRTLNVLDIQAKARLNYAPTLWLGGDLLAAGAQIAAIKELTPTLLLPDTLLQASDARATLTEASEWWGKVTTAQAERNWAAMAAALDALAALAGFGPDARYPQNRTQTVSDLQETVRQQLATAQVKPTAIITLPTYTIAIAEISEQDFAVRSGGSPIAGVNTYLEGPDGVVIRAGGVEIALSNRFTLLQGQGVVELVSDGSGEQVVATNNPVYSMEPGKYYQIIVTKVS
jgi:hypothetical protein